MSFLDRIDVFNHCDLSRFIPFLVANQCYGWVRPSFADDLARFPGVFEVSDREVLLNPALEDYSQRTEAVAAVVQQLADEQRIRGWYNEAYPVTHDYHQTAEFEMDRAAAPYFGLRAFGVHVNGIVEKSTGDHIWVGVRASDKPHFPGKYDHIVAGGQPVGLSLLENVIKESAEEAGIPEFLARQARAIGKVTYCIETECCLKPDTLFTFDLILPESFVPVATDGEVDHFELWPIEKLAEVVAHTDKFKPNCNLVIIDFLIRRGVINETLPDYIEIKSRLSRPLPSLSFRSD